MRPTQRQPNLVHLYFIAVVFFSSVLLGLAVTACHPNVSTNPEVQLVQVVRGVNDVTTAAITANRAGQLSDDATARILTVNKQVLDVIEARPIGYRAQALTVITNAKQGLPPALAAVVNPWLDKIVAALGGN